MLKHIVAFALLALTTLGPGRAQAAAFRVVATVPDLAALAAEIGGEHVKVTSLSLPTQDPHFVDARPNLALELSKADLLLLVGLDLEVGWLPTLLTGSRNASIQLGAPGYLDCSTFVPLLQVPQGQVSRAQGDIPPGGNPHYLYDPRRAEPVAQGIAARLAKLDPEHAADYAANLATLLQELHATRAELESKAASLTGVPVVAYHQSMPYLSDWLGFELAAHIEPKPGIPPTPAHVAKVLSTMKQRHVHLVIQEGFYPTTTSELVAGQTGAHVVAIPGGTNFHDGETYSQFIARVVGLLLDVQP